jgi:hypothetical protein
MDDNLHFVEGEHKYLFICRADQVDGGIEGNQSISFLNGSVEFLHPDDGMDRVLNLMQKSEKIIIHGLWREKINDLLVANPELFPKSFWFMYGGDYYHKETYSENHIRVMEKVGFLVTDINADAEFVRREYGAKGEHIRSLLYNSSVCSSFSFTRKKSSELKIILGHSGISDNQHIKYLNQLSQLKGNFNIYCPLSYPERNDYIDNVLNLGNNLFGDRFKPMLDFMPKENYEKFLSENIDIAICASWRTHGIGTTTTLLATGAKVYIDRNATSWVWFKDMGVKLFSLQKLETCLTEGKLEKIDALQAIENRKLMLGYFSESNLLRSLNDIFITRITS